MGSTSNKDPLTEKWGNHNSSILPESGPVLGQRGAQDQGTYTESQKELDDKAED